MFDYVSLYRRNRNLLFSHYSLFLLCRYLCFFFFFFQAEDGIRDLTVTGVQTCALPIFQAGRIEILRCALQGRSALRRSNVRRAFGIGSGRALTNGGAKVAAVAHQEKNRKSGVEGKRVDLGGRRIIKKKKKKKMKEIGAR